MHQQSAIIVKPLRLVVLVVSYFINKYLRMYCFVCAASLAINVIMDSRSFTIVIIPFYPETSRVY